MLSRKLKLYLPFVAVVVAQAAFVVAAPSNAPGASESSLSAGVEDGQLVVQAPRVPRPSPP